MNHEVGAATTIRLKFKKPICIKIFFQSYLNCPNGLSFFLAT